VEQFFIGETTTGFVQTGPPPPVPLTSFWNFWVMLYGDIVTALGASGPVIGPYAGSFEFVYEPSTPHYQIILTLEGNNDEYIAGSSWELLGTSNYTDNDAVRVTYGSGGGILSYDPPPVLPEGLWTNQTFWGYMGVIFEGLHWLLLADFGQVEPTEYPSLLSYNTSNLNLSGAELYPATNNIFDNSTLYELTLGMISSFQDMNLDPPISSNDFPLQPNQTVLVQSYNCQVRELKQPASLLITLIAADYVLIVGGYKLITWIAGYLERRREDGISF
jgi:hypothetical protein